MADNRGSGAIAWRSMEEGRRAAREARLPILVCAEPWWTTSAQRLEHVAAADERLSEALTRGCVPVRIDPFEEPDVAARLTRQLLRLGGTGGPPAMAVADPDGRVLVPFVSLAFEGAAEHPSLAAVVEAAAEIARRPASDETADVPHAGSGKAQVIQASGAIQASGTIRTAALRRLAEAGRTSQAARTELADVLGRLLRGGVRDHLGAGFHRAGRDDSLIVPHFEKPLAFNAELAAALALSASVVGGRLGEDCRSAAEATAALVLAEVASDPSCVAIAADSDYYTWTPREFAGALPAGLQQAGGLHFGMTRAEVPHVLYAAKDSGAIAALGYRGDAAVDVEIAAARECLARARCHRTPPARVVSDATGARMARLAGLARAAAAGIEAVDAGDLRDELGELSRRRFDARHGWRHSDGAETFPAWDQAAARDAEIALSRLGPVPDTIRSGAGRSGAGRSGAGTVRTSGVSRR